VTGHDYSCDLKSTTYRSSNGIAADTVQSSYNSPTAAEYLSKQSLHSDRGLKKNVFDF